MSLPYPILTAEEAAALIQNGETIGFSGFTPAARQGHLRARSPNAPRPNTRRTGVQDRRAHRRIHRRVARRRARRRRCHELPHAVPVQRALRSQINSGKVRFVDMHLSMLPQAVRYGFLGKVHWAVVEACDLTAAAASC